MGDLDSIHLARYWRKLEDGRDLNIEMHRRIIRMSRNPVLAAVGETVLMMLAERLKPLESRAPSGVALEMHRKLLIAFRKRNAAAARAIMERDIAAVGGRFALLDAGKHSHARRE
jgi:DNA-binding GntR family transcriptional regulator